MWARTQLKIGWRDLVSGAIGCLWPGERERLAEEVEAYFDASGEWLAAYSVRSGFDLLLQALDLKAGDEVVFAALNVRGMVKAARAQGLVTVPVDLDLATMRPLPDRLEQALSPRSKVFVAPHLFGAHVPLDEAFTVARKHGLVVVEDCAQAFNGRAYPGNEKADVAMFSFGPIKTATALGGALIRVRDEALRARMRQIQSTYPVQDNRKHLSRIVKFAGFKVLTWPAVLGAVHRYQAARGRSIEDAVANKVRDVAPLKKSKSLRWQPSAGMLALMKRRLYGFVEGSLEQRRALGARLAGMVGDVVRLPANANTYHDYWVFAFMADDPKTMIDALRAQGFDAADLPRSQAVEAPDDRPHLAALEAARLMRDLVVVPCYPGMPDREIDRLARAIRDAAETGSSQDGAQAGEAVAMATSTATVGRERV